MKRIYQKTAWAVLFSSALLAGCGEEAKSPDLASVQPTQQQLAETRAVVAYDIANGDIPYPNDILFAGSTDGTLNIPIPADASASDPRYALNALDGFSTSAPISVSTNKTADSATLASGVKVFEVTTDPTTKAVTGLTTALTYGVDFVASSSADGKKLAILPLKPLKPSSSYLVVLTNVIKDSEGNPFQPSLVYSYLKSSSALIGANGKSVVSGLSDASAQALEPLRQLTQAQLAVANAAGVDPTSVVVSWSFSTQSIGLVLDKIATPANVTNSSLAVQSAGSTTSIAGGSGKADIYVGTMSVPYYLAVPTSSNPTAPLTQHWTGQQGGELTRYAVAQGDSPKKVTDQTIPVILTLPNANSGQTQPANGWPVVIFQHGITRNRADVLAIADTLASAGYAAVAIDLPLHGITPTDAAAAFRIPGVKERTFDLDFVTQDANGSIIASQPDGVVDSSGRHFIQLTSLLTTRDNLRQGISDLVQLRAALKSIQGAAIDGDKVSFVGHSLGAMVGGSFVKRETDLKAAVFAMPGTQAAYILSNSPTFSPEIKAGLQQSAGIQPDSAEFNSFILAAQTAVDAGDPVNRVGNITVPSLVFEVAGDGSTGTSDQVIPNSVATAPLAGTEPWIKLQGLNQVTASGAVTGQKGVIRYTAGTHGSILDPSASAAVTTSMQTAMGSFIATQGTQVNVGGDASVIQQ